MVITAHNGSVQGIFLAFSWWELGGITTENLSEDSKKHTTHTLTPDTTQTELKSITSAPDSLVQIRDN
jgi:hypothetical protein